MELLFFFFVALFLRLKDILYIVYLNKKKKRDVYRCANEKKELILEERLKEHNN